MLQSPNFVSFNMFSFERFLKNFIFLLFTISEIFTISQCNIWNSQKISYTKLGNIELLVTFDREVLSTWNFQELSSQELSSRVINKSYQQELSTRVIITRENFYSQHLLTIKNEGQPHESFFYFKNIKQNWKFLFLSRITALWR